MVDSISLKGWESRLCCVFAEYATAHGWCVLDGELDGMLDDGLDQPASRSFFPKNFFTTIDTRVATRPLPRRADSALSVRRTKRLDLVARQCPGSKWSEPSRRGRPICTEQVANPGKCCTRGGVIEAATPTQRHGAFSPGGGEAGGDGKIDRRPVRRTLQIYLSCKPEAC